MKNIFLYIHNIKHLKCIPKIWIQNKKKKHFTNIIIIQNKDVNKMTTYTY